MRYIKSSKWGMILWLAATVFLPASYGAERLPHPDTYLLRPNEIHKLKQVIDDPTDLIATYPLKDAVPPEIYHFLTFDVEDTKRRTAEILGFRSPDLVGEIAPDIKSGKYTYKDLERFPGLKALFPPELLLHIKPAGPPLIGSVPTFEIIPTRQLYWFHNLSQTTKQNLGKTKLDKEGYIVPLTWKGGYPFPRPSGEFKAQQVYYNFDKRADTFDMCCAIKSEGLSFNRNLTRDKYSLSEFSRLRYMGRTLFPPYGWLDEHSKRSGEAQSFSSVILEPRKQRGTVLLNHKYEDPDKMDQWLIFVPSLRRIRKMNATDTQEPAGDLTYDDFSHLSQKITPKKYPYRFEIIAEREYLMPIAYNTSKTWIDSKNGYALTNFQFMRRPCYVLQMTQLDPNYIYGKRILYIDKENFLCALSANYDQNGRLHRTQIYTRVFLPDIAQLSAYGMYTLQFDHIDLHSTFQAQFSLPAPFKRKDFTIELLTKRGK